MKHFLVMSVAFFMVVAITSTYAQKTHTSSKSKKATAKVVDINSIPKIQMQDDNDNSVTLGLWPSPKYVNYIKPEFDVADGSLRVTATLQDGQYQQWVNTGVITNAWKVTGTGTININVEKNQNGNWTSQPLRIKTSCRVCPDPTVKLIDPSGSVTVWFQPGLSSNGNQ